MKLTRHQKQIVKAINDGAVFDLYSYAIKFGNTKRIQYNLLEVNKSFNNHPIPKTYYYPSGTSIQNIIDEERFRIGLETNEYNVDNYCKCELTIGYNTGIRSIKVSDNNLQLNFYTGVDIICCFDDFLDFCTIWQYLKDEMLIMECSEPIDYKTIGLFYFSEIDKEELPIDIDRTYKKFINFSDFKIDDKYFIDDKIYELSKESFDICKDFIGKRIIKTPKLNLFVKKKYRTYEERSQKTSFFLAIIAIIVSIIIAAFAPLYNNLVDDMNSNSQGSTVSTTLEDHNKTITP